MAGKADIRAMFKAARGQRDAAPGKLTKEQLRQLRAQRISQENTEAHASAPVAHSITASTEEMPAHQVSKEARSVMPPPPPKVGMSSSVVRPLAQEKQSPSVAVKTSAAVASAPGFQKPLPFKPDSQLSRDSTNRAGSVLSDASTGAVAHASAAPNNAAESSQMARRQNGGAEVGLPSGFFEAEAAVSEGGSAADNPHGQTTAYFSDEALSDKASIFADHSPAAASAVRGGPSLPSGFFEAEDRATHTRSVEDETDPSPVQYNASATSNPPTNHGALPKGFFASSEAEAQARGEPPPKKKTKTETMDEFMASIAEDVRGMEERDQAEAEEAAVDRSNKEAFEQKMRLQRIAELRAKKVPTSALPDVVEVQAAVLPEELRGSLGKRKRPAFSYEAVLEGVTADEEDDDDEEEEEVLDWRSKAVA